MDSARVSCFYLSATKRSRVAQGFLRDRNHAFFGGEKRRVTKTKLTMETLIRNRQNGTSLLFAQLCDGKKSRRHHIDAGDLLFVQLLNQFRRFLEQCIGRKDPTQVSANV